MLCSEQTVTFTDDFSDKIEEGPQIRKIIFILFIYEVHLQVTVIQTILYVNRYCKRSKKQNYNNYKITIKNCIKYVLQHKP